MAIQLGIIEIRNIVKTIKEYHGDDFTNYAMTSFRRRLAAFIEKKNTAYIAELLDMLKSPSIYEEFLYTMAVEDTDMFRDPATWAQLRDYILPRACTDKCKIWMAGSNSGEELYSLLIMLYEQGYLNTADIICSTFSQKRLEEMKQGRMHFKKVENSRANYDRYAGLHTFSDYFDNLNENPTLKPFLLQKVRFSNIKIMREPLSDNTHLLIFRNQMLYFNRVLQHQVLEKLHGSINKGGFFVIGNKESIESFNIYNSFTPINQAEGIYKKPSN